MVDHLEKAEQCNCTEVLADYADRVDYFDKGIVEKNFIARDCSAYVKAWPQLTLRLTDISDLRQKGNGQYIVQFEYDFEARNPARGKTSRGHASDTWRLENYRIVYHRETVTKR